jgi:3'-phosphoadenosine 5'-phosphosulfate sulfotransferase (PAPS reductase)/FAD synthetase
MNTQLSLIAEPATLDAVRALVAKHGRDLAFVVNHSGGKDSQRMLGYIREHFPQATTYVVMADTGFEHVKPVPAIDWARSQAARFALELHVVRNPNKTYLEMVERRGMFPSASTRQCTSDLKRGPIQKFIRSLREKIVINCTGIRAEESAARAKQNPWKMDDGMSKAGRTVYGWMPIFEMTLEDVLAWHWAEAQPLHPVYVDEYHRDGSQGGYLRRFSCRVCIFATDHDLGAIYKHDREAFDLVAELEQRIGFTMRAGKSLFEIVGQA